jgi:hypothetical protein
VSSSKRKFGISGPLLSRFKLTALIYSFPQPMQLERTLCATAYAASSRIIFLDAGGPNGGA